MNIERMSLETLAERLADGIDLFICSASFEERCRSVADHLPLDQVRHAIVAETEHTQRYVSGNGNYLRARFIGRLTAIQINSGDPVETADALLNGLSAYRDELRHGATVLIDLTAFNHEVLLILIKLLTLTRFSSSVIKFVYASAAEYSVGDSDENKWLSKGVCEVRSILGFPGEILPSRRQHLIVLVGFEHERAAELIKSYEPNVISLGHGRAGTETSLKHDIANKYFHELVAATAATYGEVRKFQFACNNPLEAQSAIEKEIRRFKSMNTVIAPMNTKLSTLGAVLAALNDQTIQLCYARPNQYNYKAYSAPGTDCYLLELPELFHDHTIG